MNAYILPEAMKTGDKLTITFHIDNDGFQY